MNGRRNVLVAVAGILAVPALALAGRPPASSSGFTLATARSAVVVERGEARTLRVRVRREPGFGGPVALGAWRLPAGARAVWMLPGGRPLPRKRPGRRVVVLPARAAIALLRVEARPRTRLGRFRVRISALAPHRRSRRWVAIAVRDRAPQRPGAVAPPNPVAGPGADAGRPRSFAITGRPVGALRPGATAPVELEISNPNGSALMLTHLRVALEPRTSKGGCDAGSNYEVRQFSGRYPLVIAPGTTALRAVVPDARLWPQVTMRDLPVNQDACKGAKVTLRFEGAGGG